jgi:hypothetical protein
VIPRGPAARWEYLTTLDDTAWGAASDVVPKFVSPSDPAAQWTGAHKRPASFAYSGYSDYRVDAERPPPARPGARTAETSPVLPSGVVAGPHLRNAGSGHGPSLVSTEILNEIYK